MLNLTNSENWPFAKFPMFLNIHFLYLVIERFALKSSQKQKMDFELRNIAQESPKIESWATPNYDLSKYPQMSNFPLHYQRTMVSVLIPESLEMEIVQSEGSFPRNLKKC